MATLYRDDPRRRLPPPLMAGLVSSLALLALAGFLVSRPSSPTAQQPIEVEVVELRAPTPLGPVAAPPRPILEVPAPPVAATPPAPTPHEVEVVELPASAPSPAPLRPVAAPPRPVAAIPPAPVAGTPPPPLPPLLPVVPRVAEASPVLPVRLVGVVPAPPEAKPRARPHPAPARTKPIPAPSPPVVPAVVVAAQPAPSAPPPAIERDVVLLANAPLSVAEQSAIDEHRRQVAEMLFWPFSIQEEAKKRREAMTQKAPPLTAEAWALPDPPRLVGAKADCWDSSYVCTAMSRPNAPPLTQAQWDELDRIYYVGGYYRRHEDYRYMVAAVTARGPQVLADLTAEERGMILARRGMVLETLHSVSVSSKVTLLEITNLHDYALRGTPAIPVDAPPPALPDALQQQKAEWIAVARVHVARDGSTEISITEPAADSSVNRALEDALKGWRFRPTFIGGSLPQDSTIELRVKVSVS